MAGPRHDWGFFYWAAVGFLLCFGFVTGFSIGLPFFWLGMILLIRGIWRGPPWPADLGLPAGIGAACLVLAIIIAANDDLSPRVWTTVGIALATAPTALFWWLRCRPRHRAEHLSASG
jgi:hypothetical protein